MTRDARQIAQGYIDKGISVVPLLPVQKKSVRENWQQGGFTAADFAPEDNIGILLGKLSKGLTDIDLDIYEPDIFRECFPATGSSFGRASKPQGHLLFYCDAPGKTRRWKTATGKTIVELRADGAQTMAPGSIHPSGEPITWSADSEPAPATWQELESACEDYANAVRATLGEPPIGAAPVSTQVSPPPAAAGAGDHQRLFDRAAVYANYAKYSDQGGRNLQAFNLAGHLAAFTDGAERLGESEICELLRTRWNRRNKPPLDDTELAACVASALKHGKPRAEHAAQTAGQQAQHSGEPEPPPLPAYIDVADFLAQPIPMADPIIDGLLRRGETAILVSSSKSRKTWTAQELCVDVATGAEWLGLQCRKGRALLIDCELQRATLQYRIRAVLFGKDVMSEAIRGRLALASWRGQTVTLERLTVFLAAIKPGDFDLIIIDPIYKLYPKGFEENDNAAMAELFGNFITLAERAQAALMLVCHSPKGDTSARTTIDLVSGAGSAGRAVDVAVALRAHEASKPGAPVIVRETITRSFDDLPPKCFRWEHPKWIADSDLDPRDLKRPGGRRRNNTEVVAPPPKPTWDTARFVADFITDKPQVRAAIIAKALAAGVPNDHQAASLLDRAVALVKAYTWKLPKDRKSYVANIPQSTLADAKDSTPQ